MFLQISNSSAFLIFCARTTGLFFMSRPALELFLSAVVSQLVVNLFLLYSDGFIVVELAAYDIGMIWLYDLAWLLIIDGVKMSINKLTDAEKKTMGQFAAVKAARASRASRASKAKGLSKDVRVSISGMPMTPRGGQGAVAGAMPGGAEKLW